jgi:hypothetical protein
MGPTDSRCGGRRRWHPWLCDHPRGVDGTPRDEACAGGRSGTIRSHNASRDRKNRATFPAVPPCASAHPLPPGSRWGPRLGSARPPWHTPGPGRVPAAPGPRWWPPAGRRRAPMSAAAARPAAGREGCSRLTGLRPTHILRASRCCLCAAPRVVAACAHPHACIPVAAAVPPPRVKRCQRFWLSLFSAGTRPQARWPTPIIPSTPCQAGLH